MRILFCDDNTEILQQLQRYVREFFRELGGKQPEYASYSSGDDLLRHETYADIAFLDVEMPGRSGIYVGDQLKDFNPHIKIMIITAYPDYLDEAMRFQVYRYLSKPIDKNRLFRNLKDAVYQYNMDTKEIPIPTQDGIVVRPAEQIICVESLKRKAVLLTTEQTFQTTRGIKEWREVLTLPCFYFPYRSFIINMKYVTEIKKDLILLTCGKVKKEAYLSRRKYQDFCDTYLLYLESMR